MNTCKFKMPLCPPGPFASSKGSSFIFFPVVLVHSHAISAFVCTVNNFYLFVRRRSFPLLCLNFNSSHHFFFFCCFCCCLRVPSFVYILLHNYPILNNEIQLQIECGKRVNCILAHFGRARAHTHEHNDIPSHAFE